MLRSPATLLIPVALFACGDATARGRDAATDDADVRLPSAACGDDAQTYPAGTSEGSILYGGLTRTFRVHVPPAYDGHTPLPVVLMLHGGGGSGRQLEEASSGMSAIADREGFIAVYPDGTGVIKTWNAGGCCGAAVNNGVDDVGFVAALLDHLESETCLDQRRVFAAGMSNGSMLSHRLACALSHRIAAIGPVAGTEMAPSCSPTRPVPVMHTHGTDDGHVLFEGGEGCGPAGVSFTSVPETMERWRIRNGCDATTESTFSEGDGACARFTGCNQGADVVLCTVAGGGHSWPGGAPSPDVVDCPADGTQSTSFDASEAIYRFFEAHPMPLP